MPEICGGEAFGRGDGPSRGDGSCSSDEAIKQQEEDEIIPKKRKDKKGNR